MTLFGPEPIRGELLGVERLEELAEAIARHRVAPSRPPNPGLLSRTRENGRVLLRCYRTLAAVINEERASTPAAEWLVDNFHIVEEALNEIRTDLPPGFYRQLPTLEEGPLAGAPRALELAWTFVAHTDSRFDEATLKRFVLAFQRAEALRISEVWAVPIALRQTLIENLRRLAVEIVESRAARLEADQLVNLLLGQTDVPADPQAFRSLGDSALTTSFAVRLAQRLRDQDPDTTPAARWLDERLAARGTSAHELVRIEHSRQAAANVTVRNVITSLRIMASFDWRDFVEKVSVIDRLFRAETQFGAMDFATRDRYRHAVEDLARGSGRSEINVARHALTLAGGRDRRAEDLGHYLISKGRPSLEHALGYQVSLRQRLTRAYIASATWSYLGSIGIVTAFFLCLPILYTRPRREPARRPRRRGPRGAARLGRGHRAGQPRRRRDAAAAPAAAARARGRRAARAQDPRRGADAPHRPGADRRANRAAGRPLSGQRRRRAELRPRVGLDGFARGARTRRRVAARRRAGGHRGAQQAARPGEQRRAALLPLPSPAPLEPERGALDGLGAQARQAARAESSAARRGRHLVRLGRAQGAVFGSLRDHARRGHPAAAGGGGAADRDPRAPAEPAAPRAARRPRRRGLRHSPAADRSDPAHRARGLAVPARLLRPGRHRSLLGRGVGRLPGPLRRGLVHRQGHLRHRRVRASSGGAGAGEHAPQSRSLRGALRASRARHGHRALRRLPGPLRGRGGPTTPVGARRLAAFAVADPRRRGRRRHPRQDPHDRPLEDARQLAALALGARRLSGACALVDPARRRAAGVDQAGLSLSRGARARTGVNRGAPAATRGLQAGLSAWSRRKPGAGRRAHRARRHLAGAPSVAHGRRRRAYPLATRRDAAANARVGLGRASEIELATRPRPHLLGDVGRGGAGTRRGPGRGVRHGRGPRGRRAVRRALGAVPRGAALDQPSGRHPASRRARRRRTAAHRGDDAAELAILRDLRDRGGQLAPARQLPGRSATGRGAPNVAHQHRRLPALDGGRARPRLHRHARRGGSRRGNPVDARGPRALPRTYLQLVRHAHAQAARAPLRVLRRQRQPRRPPERAGRRRARARGRADRRRRGPARDRRGARLAARRAAGGVARGRRRPPCRAGGRAADPRRLAQAPARARDRGPRARGAGPRGRRGGRRRRRVGGRRPGNDRVARPRPRRARAMDRRARRHPPVGRGRAADGRRRREPARHGACARAPAGARARRSARARRHRGSGLRRGHDRGARGGGASGRAAREAARRRRAAGPRALRRHGLRVPVRPAAPALLHRLSRGRWIARRRALRSLGLGGAADQLCRDRPGRRAGRALVPPRPPDDAGRVRYRARLVVGLDVRVLDARAGHAGTRRQPARADVPPGRPAADLLRAGSRYSLGYLGIGLQRARPRPHLS